jgi:peptide chain release factor 1
MNETILEKTAQIKKRYEELSAQIADAAVIAQQSKWQQLMREHASLAPLLPVVDTLEKAQADMEEAQDLLEHESDAQLCALARMQLKEAQETLAQQYEQLQRLLLPKDPNDARDVIVEVRAGVGGEEAALFAGDLLRMYTRYAERVGWKAELLSMQETGVGGVKEAVLQISGRGAYSRLKFESGIHRVQRVPATESAGRIHTSAATVAVLPQAQDVEVQINASDLRIDTYRSGGAGGQHVNKTESAIRITHLPTGIVVSCQNERSQIQNRETAMRMLRTRLYDYYASMEAEQYSSNRRTLVGSGDRSERIRTYNFPQSRVTDHRIGRTQYQLELFMDGDLQQMLDALMLADETARLEASLRQNEE